MKTSVKLAALIAALMVSAAATAATKAETAQIALIEACRVVTMGDGELKSCTDGMVAEVLATIGVR